jgi:hypothetical protein
MIVSGRCMSILYPQPAVFEQAGQARGKTIRTPGFTTTRSLVVVERSSSGLKMGVEKSPPPGPHLITFRI